MKIDLTDMILEELIVEIVYAAQTIEEKRARLASGGKDGEKSTVQRLIELEVE